MKYSEWLSKYLITADGIVALVSKERICCHQWSKVVLQLAKVNLTPQETL